MPSQTEGGSAFADEHDLGDRPPGGSLLNDLEPRNSHHRTRRRSSINLGQASAQNSLAFELAHGMSPSRNTRSFTAGLEASQEVQSLSEESGIRDQDAGIVQSPSPYQVQEEVSGKSSSPDRYTFTNDVLTRDHPELGQSSQKEDLTMPEAVEYEADVILFRTGNAALEDSLANTDRFINRLRSTISTNEVSQSAPVPEVTAFIDRQIIVERLASTLIRAMYTYLKKREEQLQELKEIGAAFLTSAVTSQIALVDHPNPLRLHTPPTYSQPPSLIEEDVEEPSDQLSLSSVLETYSQPLQCPSQSFSHSNNLVSEFSSLRSITDALASSLSSIGDGVQVGKATNTKAYRKLRLLQSVLAGMRSEFESVERSQMHIRNWEHQQLYAIHPHSSRQSPLPSSPDNDVSEIVSTPAMFPSRTANGSSLGRYSEQVKGELKRALSLLENSHDRARLLLTLV